MPRFKVLAGEHVQVDYGKDGQVTGSKVWKKGEVFSCKEDLDQKFENKFERVGGDTLVPETFNSPMDQTHILDEPLAVREAAKAEGKGMVDTEPPPLPAIPGSDPRLAAKKDTEGAADVKEGDPDHPDSDEDEDGSEFGKDMSDKFKTASSKDVKVFYKKELGYTVVDSDDPKTKLSKRKLADRKAVNKFLSDFK